MLADRKLPDKYHGELRSWKCTPSLDLINVKINLNSYLLNSTINLQVQNKYAGASMKQWIWRVRKFLMFLPLPTSRMTRSSKGVEKYTWRGKPNELCSGRLEISDKVSTLLGLLQTGENHLGSRNVLYKQKSQSATFIIEV